MNILVIRTFLFVRNKNVVYFTDMVIKFPNDILSVFQIIIQSQEVGKGQILNDYVTSTSLDFPRPKY